MQKVMDFYNDELIVSLRKLEAGNLYFSIILKKQLTKNLNDANSVFIALKGNEDVKTLKEIYIKEGSLNPDASMITFLDELKLCYQTLKESYLSEEVIRKQAIEEYEEFKKHLINNVPSEEYLQFLMQNVGSYFEKETSISLTKEKQKTK